MQADVSEKFFKARNLTAAKQSDLIPIIQASQSFLGENGGRSHRRGFVAQAICAAEKNPIFA